MQQYLGEIKIYALRFVPLNFVICDGRRLEKKKFMDLYTLIGDTFTYDTSDPLTFAIPDLRNRFVKQPGEDISLGEQKGENEIVLSMEQMPEHTHHVKVNVDDSRGGDEAKNTPKDAFLNNNAANFSREATENTFLGGLSEENVGNSAPLNIANSHIKMVYAISTSGIYPSTVSPDIGFIGEIKIWPINEVIPKGWLLCDGSTYSIAGNSALGSIIGDKYGKGSNGNPKLPDFRDRFAAGANEMVAIGQTGGRTSVRLDKNNLPPHTHDLKLAVNNDATSVHSLLPADAFINKEAGPFSSEIGAPATLGGVSEEERGGYEDVDITNACLGINYIISSAGVFSPNSIDSWMGEIIIYAGFGSASLDRGGVMPCYGQILPISQFQSLFSLFGTTFGGDGRTNFGVPNLRDKIPLCLSNLNEIGKSSGANEVSLLTENLPEHNHNVKLAANRTADGRMVSIPDGILNVDAGPYSTKESENTYLGGIHETRYVGEKIDVRNPFLTINYLLSTGGVFPIDNN